MKKETHFIVLYDGIVGGLIDNITTLGSLLVSVWFNYKFIGNSKFLNGTILVMWLLWMVSKANSKTTHRFGNAKDAIKYLEESK